MPLGRWICAGSNPPLVRNLIRSLSPDLAVLVWNTEGFLIIAVCLPWLWPQMSICSGHVCNVHANIFEQSVIPKLPRHTTISTNPVAPYHLRQDCTSLKALPSHNPSVPMPTLPSEFSPVIPTSFSSSFTHVLSCAVVEVAILMSILWLTLGLFLASCSLIN